ncbi:N-acetylglucosamine-6-phosphate deacetylase [Nocardia stercoris]|nr:amidohydrolase family protein [Nocardia stercoris]
MDRARVAVCRGHVVAAKCAHQPRLVDAAGGWISPGLVDLHLHGSAGHDFADAEPDSWAAILRAHLAAGTTTALATIASTSPAAARAALATAHELAGGPEALNLAGVHLEGPCLAGEQRGAHDRNHLREPRELLEELTPIPPALRMVTLAPELPGAQQVITYLVRQGVVVAAGHSAATSAQLDAAKSAGLSHLSHLWSGQSTLTRPAAHRVPGLLEASLASDGLTAEIIADGHHLPRELLTIAHRCLGADRLCLVSDATAATGLPRGSQFRVGATTGVVHDGYATTLDGHSLCGSTTTLAGCVAEMRKRTDTSVPDILTMATATPARVLGRYPQKGSHIPGAADGDAVVFTPDLEVAAVIIAGRLVGAS